MAASTATSASYSSLRIGIFSRITWKSFSRHYLNVSIFIYPLSVCIDFVAIWCYIICKHFSSVLSCCQLKIIAAAIDPLPSGYCCTFSAVCSSAEEIPFASCILVPSGNHFAFYSIWCLIKIISTVINTEHAGCHNTCLRLQIIPAACSMDPSGCHFSWRLSIFPACIFFYPGSRLQLWPDCCLCTKSSSCLQGCSCKKHG